MSDTNTTQSDPTQSTQPATVPLAPIENGTEPTATPATRTLVTFAELQAYRDEHAHGAGGGCNRSGQVYFHFKSSIPDNEDDRTRLVQINDTSVEAVAGEGVTNPLIEIEVPVLILDNTVYSQIRPTEEAESRGILPPDDMLTFMNVLDGLGVKSGNPQYLMDHKLNMTINQVVQVPLSQIDAAMSGRPYIRPDGFLHSTDGPVHYGDRDDGTWGSWQEPERTWVSYKYPYTEEELRHQGAATAGVVHSAAGNVNGSTEHVFGDE